jgi:hypothetical protein
MFKFDPSADTVGVTGMGELEVPPALVVRRFGPPAAGDGFKISGEYVFVNDSGEPFVVHDWKATNLWDDDFPAPEQYWAMTHPDELTISTRDIDTREFQEWFLARLEEGAA